MSITGDRLRQLRKEKRYTLVEVGLAVGISYSGLASLERGENHCTATTLQLLADYYKVSTDYLLGKTDDRNGTTETADINVAFYNQHGILTEEQKKEIEGFIAYVKARDSK